MSKKQLTVEALVTYRVCMSQPLVLQPESAKTMVPPAHPIGYLSRRFRTANTRAWALLSVGFWLGMAPMVLGGCLGSDLFENQAQAKKGMPADKSQAGDVYTFDVPLPKKRKGVFCI